MILHRLPHSRFKHPAGDHPRASLPLVVFSRHCQCLIPTGVVIDSPLARSSFCTAGRRGRLGKSWFAYTPFSGIGCRVRAPATLPRTCQHFKTRCRLFAVVDQHRITVPATNARAHRYAAFARRFCAPVRVIYYLHPATVATSATTRYRPP